MDLARVTAHALLVLVYGSVDELLAGAVLVDSAVATTRSFSHQVIARAMTADACRLRLAL